MSFNVDFENNFSIDKRITPEHEKILKKSAYERDKEMTMTSSMGWAKEWFLDFENQEIQAQGGSHYYWELELAVLVARLGALGYKVNGQSRYQQENFKSGRITINDNVIKIHKYGESED